MIRGAAIARAQEVIRGGKIFVSDEGEETTLTTPDQQVEAARQWFASPRFAGIVRLYSPRQVAEQQGTMPGDYTVARRVAA